MEATKKRRRTAADIAVVVVLGLVLLVAYGAFFAAWWYVRVYGRIGFDSVLFTLTGGLGGVSDTLVRDYLLKGALPAAVCTLVTALVLFWPEGWALRCKGGKLLPLQRNLASAVACLLSLALLVHAAFNVELVEYVIRSNQHSELYQDAYVDPKDVKITFPEEKRNLVYIFLESMETSYLSKDLGGGLPYNLIPELTQLAQTHVNFSHNDTVGGFRQVTGASWTIGAMTAHTGGIPLKVPDGITDWQNGYGQDGEFLDKLTNLTSLLHDAGYYQGLMVGSVVGFGGRDTFYKNHGVDVIYDLVTARRDGIVAYNYWNDFWGMEDLYLYEYAKQELTEMARMDQPFALTMLTVDTHHIGGFTCALCGSNYEESYENAIACASKQVSGFVAWIMEQEWYENTTIVITGDHCSMDKGYFSRNIDEDYQRYVYNCFINAAAVPYQNQNRQFSALDMFPTTLAAMGCTIEGDRLGLGTNLFSKAPTLMERLGYTQLCTELSKKADYYSENFYGKDYSAPETTS